MSITGKSTLSLRKKDVINQKSPAIGFKKTMFAHKATAGDTGIALGALVTPPEMAGFTNPTAGELQAAQLYFYRKNFTLVSSLRGPLMDYLSYNLASSSQINFNGFTAEEGEIFIGVIDYNARTGLQMVDATTIVASGSLAIGSTDFNVGQSFQTNKFQGQQVGAVIVFRNGVQQFRNSNNSSVTLDGNYYEVDNGSGSSQVIRFNNAPVSQSDSILVVSNGAVAYSPDGSALQAIETLAGQIDAMVPTLASLAGVPETDFQAAPNNADLKSFGDTVLSQGDRVSALEGLPLYQSARQTSDINFPAAAATFTDLLSIVLTTGEWDISGLWMTFNNGVVTTTDISIGISSVSGNSFTDQLLGDNRVIDRVISTASNARQTQSIPSYRVTVSGTVTYYLKARVETSSTNLQYTARISARKVKN